MLHKYGKHTRELLGAFFSFAVYFFYNFEAFLIKHVLHERLLDRR